MPYTNLWMSPAIFLNNSCVEFCNIGISVVNAFTYYPEIGYKQGVDKMGQAFVQDGKSVIQGVRSEVVYMATTPFSKQMSDTWQSMSRVDYWEGFTANLGMALITGGPKSAGGVKSVGSMNYVETATVKSIRAAKGGANIAKTPVGRSGNVLEVLTKNSPTTINGTKFTGHALDQMQARGILSPSAVLDVVKNPARTFPGNTPGTTVFIRDNLKVITNKAGDIITVIPQ